MTEVITEFSKEGWKQIEERAFEIVSNEIMKEDRWLEFKEAKVANAKTTRFEVWSKCSNCILGIIKYDTGWRHYTFFPTLEFETKHSDRCMLQIGFFVMELNKKRNDALTTKEGKHD